MQPARRVAHVAQRVIVRTIYRVVTTHRTITVIRYVERVHVRYVTVINRKTVVHTVTRTITKTRTVITHVTVVSHVAGLRVVRYPTTGRMAGPQQPASALIPPVEAHIGIARLGVSGAPVWARDYIQVGWNAFTYDIVPHYGVTRFASSADFGQPGLTMISGHDDEFGMIFKNLGRMRRGDIITVAKANRTYRYSVTSVIVVTPDNVAALTATYTHSTLGLISCTPYMVDTQRVLVRALLLP